MRGATIERRTPDIIPSHERLRPIRDRILVKPLDWAPSKLLEVVRFGRPLRGIVKAVGPGDYRKRYRKNDKGERCGFEYTTTFVPTQVKPGDMVELGGLNIFDGQGYSFQDVMIEGETHLLCTEKDVCAVHDAPTQIHENG